MPQCHEQPPHEITGRIYHDLFGNLFCAKCYADLIPPYPGPEDDPQLALAREEVASK